MYFGPCKSWKIWGTLVPTYVRTLYIFLFSREFELKAGVTQPIKVYLFMSESQPLDFFIDAQNSTAITTDNQISMNFATGTEVEKRFDFLWSAFLLSSISLGVKGKFVNEMMNEI